MLLSVNNFINMCDSKLFLTSTQFKVPKFEKNNSLSEVMREKLDSPAKRLQINHKPLNLWADTCLLRNLPKHIYSQLIDLAPNHFC